MLFKLQPRRRRGRAALCVRAPRRARTVRGCARSRGARRARRSDLRCRGRRARRPRRAPCVPRRRSPTTSTTRARSTRPTGPLERARAHLDVAVGYFKARRTVAAAGCAPRRSALFVARVRLLLDGRATRASGVLVAATAATLVLTVGDARADRVLVAPPADARVPGRAHRRDADLARGGPLRVSGRASSRRPCASRFALWSTAKNEDRVAISPGWTAHAESATGRSRSRRRGRATSIRPSASRTWSSAGTARTRTRSFIEDGFDLVVPLVPPLSAQPRVAVRGDDRVRRSARSPSSILVTLGFFDDREPDGRARGRRSSRDARRLLERRLRARREEHPGYQVWKRRNPDG